MLLAFQPWDHSVILALIQTLLVIPNVLFVCLDHSQQQVVLSVHYALHKLSLTKVVNLLVNYVMLGLFNQDLVHLLVLYVQLDHGILVKDN
jgi:hypothetical protein